MPQTEFLTFLVTPAAMPFRSRQQCNLTHAVLLRVLKETSYEHSFQIAPTPRKAASSGGLRYDLIKPPS
jgi:hypothetical protein